MKRMMLVGLLTLLLCGCTVRVDKPYEYIREGVYASGDVVSENGNLRSRTPTDNQALQFVPDGGGISLVPGELAYYTGSLYSLSNYRELLLKEGYITDSLTRTSEVLDTTLSRGGDRVRLIYQQSGSVRILFENKEGLAHILLEGIM